MAALLAGEDAPVTDDASVPARGNPDDGGRVIQERLQALGRLVEVSAAMEHCLRSAFCSLVGSKYAAVVAAGQGVSWLIEQCKALVDANLEMPEDARNGILDLDALGLCGEANDRRNVLVHGLKTASRETDGAFFTLRSRQRKLMPDRKEWTPADVRQVAWDVSAASGRLFAAMSGAVSPEAMVLDDALAWERQRRRESR